MRSSPISDMKILLGRGNPFGRYIRQLRIMVIDDDSRRRHDIDGKLYASRAGALTDGQGYRIAARDRIAVARISAGPGRPVPEVPKPGGRTAGRSVRELYRLPYLWLDRAEAE